MTDIKSFLQEVKVKCESKAKQMNALELSILDARHEDQLKKHFGFNDKTLATRKKQLAK